MDVTILLYALIPLLFIIVFGYILAVSRARDADRREVKQHLTRLEHQRIRRVSCPICRTLNLASAKYCHECGYPLNDASQP